MQLAPLRALMQAWQPVRRQTLDGEFPIYLGPPGKSSIPVQRGATSHHEATYLVLLSDPLPHNGLAAELRRWPGFYSEVI